MKTLPGSIHSFVFLSLALFYPVLGHAQDAAPAEPPPPSPPYVGDLSGNFTLVKKFTYKASDLQLPAAEKAAQEALSPASSKPLEVDAVKNGPVRKDTEHFADGSSRDIWRQDTYRFSVYSAHPNSIIVDVVNKNVSLTSPNQYQDTADFPELSWIKGPMYQGIQMQQGKKCYLYKKDDQTAWIDVGTRLPVYFDSKALLVSYTYSAPPDDPLQLPQAYADKLAKFKRLQRGQM